jgi:hypothetical protein
VDVHHECYHVAVGATAATEEALLGDRNVEPIVATAARTSAPQLFAVPLEAEAAAAGHLRLDGDSFCQRNFLRQLGATRLKPGAGLHIRIHVERDFLDRVQAVVLFEALSHGICNRGSGLRRLR